MFLDSRDSMVARERISNGNNIYFIFFSTRRANQSIKNIFLKVLKNMFLSFDPFIHNALKWPSIL